MLKDTAWNIFNNTGNIQSYLLYREMHHSITGEQAVGNMSQDAAMDGEEAKSLLTTDMTQ